MTPPRRVGVRVNLNKEHGLSVARRVIQRLEASGIEVSLQDKVTKALGRTVTPDPSGREDLFLCLGGDGTMLSAVRSLDGAEIPVLGINLGGLGFLTAISSEELDSCLDAVVAGSYQIEDRRLLKAKARDQDGNPLELYALNDIVVDEGSFARRAAVLKLSISETFVGTFTADGLIVATATGSTAYSLSANGPIVHPVLPVLVATPICAHSLSIRPLVFSQDEKVAVENILPDASLKVIADGQDAHRIEVGSPIEIELSSRKARLAFVGDRPYYQLLRTKLNWGGIPKDR